MHRGYVKAWRRLFASDLWLSEPFTKGQAWMDLIGLASHKDDGWILKRGIRVQLARGEVGWSEVTLSERWKWSRGKTRRFLSQLEKEEKIVQQKNNVSACIRIENYEVYQGDGTADGTANGQQTDSKRYSKKNVKNEKKKNTPRQTPPTSAHQYVTRWWCWAFEEVEGFQYVYRGGRDGKTVKSLLSTLEAGELLTKMAAFLVDNDKWLDGKRDLGTFAARVNSYNGTIPPEARGHIAPPEGVRWSQWKPWEATDAPVQ